ncbi:hypothetical protein GCM10027300_11500 [Modestobacter lapidis]|nr:trypsin-like peptidase domain-containing protein [Modestobacter lapidis]
MIRTAARTPVRRALATAVLGTVAGAVLLATPPSALAAEPTATAGSPGDAEKSLVYLQTFWQGYVEFPMDGEWYRSDEPVEVYAGQCSGWFASAEGHIVTAGHCVEDDGARELVLEQFLTAADAPELLPEAIDGWRVVGTEGEAEPTRVVIASQPSAVDGAVLDDPLTVQVVDWQPFENGDVALLKANQLATATPPLAVATDPPAVGDPVTAMGYPGSVQDVSNVDRLRASFKSGTVSSVQTSDTGVVHTEINADLSGGMSGGPTVDADGRVLGVNSFLVRGEEQGFNFITDGEALRGFLERHGVEGAPEAGTEDVGPAGSGQQLPGSSRFSATASPAGSLPEWPYLAGGGAGAVLLAAGGAFLLGRRGSRRPAPCSHAGSARDARFCTDCGTALLV